METKIDDALNELYHLRGLLQRLEETQGVNIDAAWESSDEITDLLRDYKRCTFMMKGDDPDDTLAERAIYSVHWDVRYRNYHKGFRAPDSWVLPDDWGYRKFLAQQATMEDNTDG